MACAPPWVKLFLVKLSLLVLIVVLGGTVVLIAPRRAAAQKLDPAAQADTATPGVLSIATNGSHTCMVVGAPATGTGGVKCWGANWNGQLGDGTTEERSIPTDVVGLTSGVKTVYVGEFDTCALTATGGDKC